MRILEILEHDGQSLRSHRLCLLGITGAGEPSFNGERRALRLLAPGARALEEKSAGFVLSESPVPTEGTLSVDDVLCGIGEADQHGTSALSMIHGGFVSVSRRCAVLRPIRVGILTVSDKGSRGERDDRSGPALAREVPLFGGTVTERATVPDDEEAIARILERWCDEGRAELILTTGGTGFSPRDVTPEALERVGERKVPGIGEAMRRASAAITPRAALSRSNAVIRGKTLIIALPGSEKGAVECLTAVAPSLRHGIEILCGWDGECGNG